MRFFVMYGQTEATARISYLPPEELPSRAGSVGHPIAGGSIEIHGDDGAVLGADEVGEVVYSGPNVMLGYATCREDLGRGDDLQGVLRTGDLGYLDREGFLYLTGRNTRIAKIFGMRVNLGEVEEAASSLGLPVAVVDGGDRLVVFLEGGAEEDKDRCREIVFSDFSLEPLALDVRLVESMPRTSRGKIDYRRVAQWI